MTNATPPNKPRLLMVRHTAVDTDYAGRCYGARDVALSPEGQAQLSEIAAKVAAENPSRVYHSGLQRTTQMAVAIIDRTSRPASLHTDQRLAEMNFGAWEGQTWDEIYTSGQDIARLIHEPRTFSPPGGETTFALRDRVLGWLQSVPRQDLTVAVSHGGSIAALRGALAGCPIKEWPELVPDLGEIIELNCDRVLGT
ncbi:MAG: histidine phosphatase family protein [Hyphomicrobiaceae bacterium]